MDGKCCALGLIDVVYNELYGLSIGKIYTPEQLAYYNKANQFPNLITTNINGSIASVMLPALSNEQENIEKFKNMMRRSIKTSAFILFPVLFGLAAVAKPIVEIVLTDKWLSAVPLMQILCFSYALWPIHTINLQAISAMGRSDIFLKLEIIKKVVGVIALVLSLPFGIIFMVGTKILIALISSFINSFPNKKLLNYGIKEQVIDILPTFLLAFIMAVIVYLINLNTSILIIELIIKIIIGGFIYFLGAILLRLESFKYIETMLKNLFKKE